MTSFIRAICLAASLALVSASPAAAQRPVSPEVVREIADQIRPTLPRNFADAVNLVAVESRGTFLIFTIELSDGENAPASLIATSFLTGFCQADVAAQLFEEGLRIRLDLRVNGRIAEGTVIDRCPQS